MSAAERNRAPIFEALMPWLAAAHSVLEIGAGDATHARYACQRCPHLAWQVSEAPAHYRRLIAALVDLPESGLAPPVALDVRGQWPADRFDVVYGANVLHIMDWPAVQALFEGAACHLNADGLLCLYGPVIEAEGALGDGNQRFDQTLRGRDPAMGLRRLADLDDCAGRHGLRRQTCQIMPADNRLMIWQGGG